MERRRLLLGIPVLLAAASAWAAAGAGQGAPAQEKKAAQAPAACADCHDDQAKAFAQNPHMGIPGAPRGNALCQTCHGEANAHMESGGEKPVQRTFAKPGDATFCTSCHAPKTEHESFGVGMHAFASGAGCFTCHTVHASVPATPLLKKQPMELCASCHVSEAAGFRDKPYAHHLGRGDMSCVSCHDPHARGNGETLKLTRAGEIACLSCHAEKRGPFVYSHVPGVIGDCMSCHQPHGSMNPHQLTRARVDQLCLECHSPIASGGLGSQPPSFHNLLLPRYRNCTVCHTAVHGSNLSPTLLK